MKLIRIFLLCTFVLSAYGADDRHVEGGDLLYPGNAVSSNRSKAVYDAEMEAIARLEVECLVIPKGTITYEKTAKKQGSLWAGHVVVGVPIHDCQLIHDMTPEQRAKQAHPTFTLLLSEFRKPKPTLVAPVQIVKANVIIKQTVVVSRKEDCKAKAMQMMNDAKEQAEQDDQYGRLEGDNEMLFRKGQLMLSQCGKVR